MLFVQSVVHDMLLDVMWCMYVCDEMMYVWGLLWPRNAYPE